MKNPVQYCSLKQAKDEYWWRADGIENQGNLNALSTQLMAGIDADSQDDLQASIFAVFDWGGVSRPSPDKSRNQNRFWVESNAQQKLLVKKIKMGQAILAGQNTDGGKYAFDGVNLRMNSSFTKVYALISHALPIYDGRVGAALGLMVRIWMDSVGASYNDVPNKLSFPWAPGVGKRPPNRNPSKPGYQNFPRLKPQSHFYHAYWNMIAGWLIQLVIAMARDGGVDMTSRDLESALFMVGYEV